LSVEKWIVKGHPAEEILKLADEQSVDMIVMGTLGRSGIEKFVLGSVADKVIRNSRIPVLTVRR
ncbi:MAG: universal stress protein, partial [Candidatus Methanoperedens sp.]